MNIIAKMRNVGSVKTCVLLPGTPGVDEMHIEPPIVLQAGQRLTIDHGDDHTVVVGVEIARANRTGSIIVRDHLGNMEIAATHHGGIVHQGRVIIEKADLFDLFSALKEYLAERMCLACGSGDPGCQCENDD